MRGNPRELTADWLMVAGGVALFVSLFLTWSHQFPARLESISGLNVALRGVPRDPTAWQVYSVADVLLAVVAAGLVTVALRGGTRSRLAVLLGAAIALGFAAHALSTPPTSGLDVVNPAAPDRGYIGGRFASSGGGETVAIVGLSVGLVGALVGAAPRRR